MGSAHSTRRMGAVLDGFLDGFLHSNGHGFFFGAWGMDACGGCQNCGPFLSTLYIRCRIILGYPKRDHNFDNHPCGRGLTRRCDLLYTVFPGDLYP